MRIAGHKFAVTLWFALFCLQLSLSAIAACPPCDGYFDYSFAGDGRRVVLSDVDFDARQTLMKRADGHLIVAGSCNNGGACVAWLNPNGSTDYSAGPSHLGFVTLAQLGMANTHFAAAGMLADGRVMLVVTLDSGGNRLVVLSRDGSAIEQQGFTFTLAGNTSEEQLSIAGIAIQPDGKVLVGGTTQATDAPFTSHMAVVRVVASLQDYDHTFGSNGFATVDFDAGNNGSIDDSQMEAMVLQPDGRILIGGNASYTTHSLAAIARLYAHGQLDLAFGGHGNGRITGGTNAGMFDIAAMLIDRQARIVVGGLTYSEDAGSSNFDMAVNRLLPDGTQDPVFGDFGIFGVPGPVTFGADQGSAKIDIVSALALQPDGSLLVAGAGSLADHYNFEVVRLSGVDGEPDDSFGVESFSMGEFACDASQINASASDLVMDRGIVVAGKCYGTGGNAITSIGIARLKLDEIFPSSFEF